MPDARRSSKGLSKNVTDLGERKIIEIIRSHLDLMPRMPVPFGDDVSAYPLENDNVAVLKTDMLVRSTDVPPGMTFWQAARKAVVMNVSDFAAKGVKPCSVLVSLGLPKEIGEKEVAEVAKGLNAGAREYGAYVVGGDTGEASDLVISVSLYGKARKRDIMLRSGAKPGDILAVTGSFGKTPLGLRILLGKVEASEKTRQPLVESVLLPQARLKEGLALSPTRTVTSAIDSSDGLAWSLQEIASASKVGFIVDKLPLDEEAKTFAQINELDSAQLVLYGGEEYEIVLTVKPRHWNEAQRAVSRQGGKLIRIGKATAERSLLLSTNNTERVIRPTGYEHFKT